MVDTNTPSSDTTSATSVPGCEPAHTFLHAENDMPLGALALPLAEARRHGIPGRLYQDALARVTVPPSVTIGCDFRKPRSGSHPSMLARLFGNFLLDHLTGAPDPGHPAFRGLRSELQLVPLLPIIDLPAARGYWVHERDFTQLLWWLTLPGNAVAGLPPQETWPHPRRDALPFSLPSAEGAVRAVHLARFFAGYPELGERLAAELGLAGAPEACAAPAEVANEAARKLLGIRVDLRIGSLVSRRDIEYAANCAGGSIGYSRFETEAERLQGFVGALVTRVGRRATTRKRGLEGAAWSCAVDAALNGRTAWMRGAGGGFLWADQVPELARGPSTSPLRTMARTGSLAA